MSKQILLNSSYSTTRRVFKKNKNINPKKIFSKNIKQKILEGRLRKKNYLKI